MDIKCPTGGPAETESPSGPRLTPATFAQQRLWFLDQLQPGSNAYLIAWSVPLRGSLNTDALERALEEVVNRHEVLKTTFVLNEGAVYTSAPAFARVPLRVVEASGPEDLLRIAEEESRTPIDLENGPMVRATLVRLSAKFHTLLLTLHHISFDGSSRAIFVREFQGLYNAFVDGSRSSLPSPPLQYADYAQWQQHSLKGKRYQKLIGYWKKQLADLPEALNLPTDRPRPATETFRGARRAFTLPDALSKGLADLAKQRRCSLFMLTLTAFQILLAKYSGQDDIVTGVPVAGRERPELEGVIGLFANEIALRLKVTAGATFLDLLAQARGTALDAFEHQDMPFEKLVLELNPERSLSRNPLFQVLFSLTGHLGGSLQLNGLEPTAIVSTAADFAKFDLSLYLREEAGDLSGWIEYSADLFEAATIERMIGHYRTLLEAVVCRPDTLVSDLPILTLAEQGLLESFNATAVDYPAERCLHQFIEEQVERTPNAIALIFEERKITYSDLNAQANQLAHHLRKLGVGPDVLVALCAERSVEMVVALLGILKAGGAYVPLDPDYPQERLVTMLRDAAPRAVLTLDRLTEALPEVDVPLIRLDTDWQSLSSEPVLNPATVARGHDLAYVIYTSGSTGKPKGAANLHSAIVNRLLWMQHEYRIDSTDHVLQKTPYSFDVSVWEFFWPLMTGACLVLARPEGHKDPVYLADLIQRHRVTTLHFVPSMLRVFLGSDVADRCGSLRRVICSGEALPLDLEREFFQRFSCGLHNLYGPTEAAVDVTYFRCEPNSVRTTVPIGKPIWNTRIRILDQHQRPQPVGIPGELHIGGAGLARGYLNQPELTAQKFVGDPFAAQPGDRLYKTGDLARWLPDGNIEYLGRLDFQVKIRGFRIELGEIEEALSGHPAVRQSLVVVREDEPGMQRLVGYVTVAAGATPTSAELRDQTRKSLPEFMVPAVVVVLDAFPLSSNGKIDRKALPAPAHSAETGESILPRTPAEEIVAGAWSNVLRLERVGVEDNFFELGGHSLLATQVISRICKAFKIRMPLRALFETPTVAGLARQAEALLARHDAAEGQPVKPVDRSGPLPLSFAQQRLWFLNALEPANPLYNITVALRLMGILHPEHIRRALDEVVRRHEALRTRFTSEDGQPTQIVCPPVSPSFSLLTAADENDARDLIRLEAIRPFDLARAPLIRAMLISLAPHDHIFVLITHHIVSDGWSSGLIIEELRSLYTAFVEGKPALLPSPSIQYADYAVWQREYLSDETLSAQLVWWKQQLAGAPAALELPTDRPRPPVESFRGAKHSIVLPVSLLEGLRKLSRTENTTLFMTLLAAFSVLLSRYSGQEEVVIGSPIAGRNRAETEKVVGLFLNTVVLRINLADNPLMSELLGRVREVALGAYAHQELPFERLVAELAPERNFSRNPLFQAMLILQNLPATEPNFAGISVHPFPAGNPNSKFDITLIATEQADGLRATLEYNTDLFDASTIARMLGHFDVLATAIVGQSDRRVLDLPLLSPIEREQVLFGWNATSREYPRDLCAHQWIERQADFTPERIAVSSGTEQFTYKQLNARANQVAHGLMRQGAGPRSRVAIRMARSANMLAGLLGILKSGAAYVPLDPHFPGERIAFILEDAEICLLLDDSNWERFNGESEENAAVVLTADAPAYLLHTSGSTGKPKGVEVSHRNLVNFLASMQREPGLVAEDILLAVTTVSFDIAGLELYLPLVSGAQVAIASREEASDANLLVRKLYESRATVLQATPATWRMLLESGWQGASRLKALCGGESLPAALAEQLMPRCRELWNMYGPTETTIWSSVFRIESEYAGSAPLGRPIANTTMYVLDSQDEPVPPGVKGDLYIGGDGVARGYWRRPELTAEKFKADPFVPGARIYRTGDLARYDSTGIIHYLGRADFQVKVRGFRIELGELETALERHEAVKECVAIATDARLVAYVTLHRSVSPVSLREYVGVSLPDYMVPAAIVVLDAFPLTPNEKVDRKALPAVEFNDLEEDRHIELRTPTEAALAAIWEDVLRIKTPGPTADFFGLGGHSLLATRVISRAQQVFGISLPLRVLFEHHNLAAFAACIDEAVRAQAGHPLPPISSASREQPIPLSLVQQRLWFLNELESHSAAYNVPCVVRLQGSLNIPALEKSIDEIVRRHDSLRTRFGSVNGEPVQIVDAPNALAINRIAVQGREGESREETVLRVVEEQVFLPFDLKAGPLFRAALIEAGLNDHILILNAHHIVSDAWSVAVMRKELGVLYQAFLNEGASPLHELPVQYADYAVWQRRVLANEQFQEQMAYWRRQLHEAPVALELPIDRPRPYIQTYAGAQKAVIYPKPLLLALKEVSNREGVTLFMTLLAACQVLLSRYTGEDDIVVGSPIAGRTRVEIENLIGFFVNTLVLRTSLEGNPSFTDLLQRVKETTLDAYANQDVPFEKLVEELRPDRSSNRTPFFQVVFALQNVSADEWTLPGLTISRFPIRWPHAKFDLMLMASENPDGLRVNFEYNSDLFDEATILRMAGHFRMLLEGITADSSQAIGALPLLTAQEEKQLLVDWNDTQRDYPQLCIHEIFEQWAAKTPDAIAVICRDQNLTYAELNERSDRLASHLRNLGVRAESRVGICVERSVEMIVGLLGLLKAGGGYVPLDPDYPAERLSYLVYRSDMQAILTVRSLTARLPADSPNLVFLDDAEWPSGSDRASQQDRARPDTLAYLMYTSGSTGEPKGVEVLHRGVVRLVCGVDYADFNDRQVMLQAGTLAFDASTIEIWGALLHGAKLVIFPERVPTAHLLGQLFEQHGISILFLTTSLFNWLVDEAPELLAHARQLMTGGDANSIRHFRRAHELLPDLELIHLYGPTETTTLATGYRVPRAIPPELLSLPIGRPIANTTTYVFDRRDALVPIGVSGELWVGGDGLARGYLNQPDATAQKFVWHTFPDGRTERLYGTGDLVRWNAAGEMEFLGRRDAQVKIRGFRIEPGEIEATLLQHPEVRECAAIVREDTPGDKRIVAYVLAVDDRQLQPSDLRIWLKQRLPEFLVPSAIVQMEAFPLRASGKVNRKAFPAPDYDAAAGEYVAPRTPVEEVVAGIWADILKLEHIGTNENFFDLGGHSLLATRVISRIRESFGIDVPLRAMFESPGIAALSTAIENVQRAEDGRTIPPLLPVARDRGLPLSYAQQRLWFVNQLDPRSSLYNVSIAMRLRGEPDRRALEIALHGLVGRHEILRTVYRVEDDRAVQFILEDWSIPLAAATARDSEDAARLLQTESEQPFRLDEDLLLRALLVEIGQTEHVLLLSTHHIATDGWSNGILKNDLMALYNFAVQGEPARLPDLRVQYADYAVWQRDWLQGEALETQLAYWRRQLTGAPPLLTLPSDRPRPTVPSYRGGVENLVISRELLEATRALGRAAGATSFMTLLAAFQILMAYYTRQTDIVLGTDLANRNDIRLESIAGFFVNLLVLRTDLTGNPTFTELLRRVRDVTLGAYSHQDVPFEKLVEELQPERVLHAGLLVQVLFVQQNTPRGASGMTGLDISSFPLPIGSKFDMAVFVTESSEGATCNWVYSTDLFDAATIAKMGALYGAILSRVNANPELRMNDLLESLAESERESRALEHKEFQEVNSQKLRKIRRRVGA